MWYVHRYTRRTNRNQTGSGMYHPIVKEQVNPGQLEGLQTNPDTTEQGSKCQAIICCELFVVCGFLGVRTGCGMRSYLAESPYGPRLTYVVLAPLFSRRAAESSRTRKKESAVAFIQEIRQGCSGRARLEAAHELPIRIPTAKTRPPPTITCTAEETIGISI